MLELRVDAASPIPLYFQICEQMRALIEGGRLKPGDQLPTESELRQHLGVSRMTVRQALAELVRDGLIIRKRAKGSFVARSRRDVPVVHDALRSFTQEAIRFGQTLETRILGQEVIPASGKVARELEVPIGMRVIMLQRLRVMDGLPTAVEVSHYPYERFPAVATLDLTNRSVYELLDKEYHALPQEAVDTFAAGPPTPAETRCLGLEPNVAVWHCQRTAFDGAGRPVEYTESTFRLDRFRFTTRRRRL
jgi:GntR family transcriptional regulator